MRSLLVTLCALTMTLGSPGPASAADPLSDLDRASACQRRAKYDCAAKFAERALKGLIDSERPELRREALRVRARALALGGQAEPAATAFRDVLDDDLNYRPAEDAPEAIKTAFEAARRTTLSARLPTSLDPGSPPLPPPPKPSIELDLYVPMEKAPELGTTRPPWSVSLGGGVAIPMPDSDARYIPGPTAALEVTRTIIGPLRAWAFTTLSLLSISEDVVIEPGYRGQLAVASGVLGLQVDIRVIDWIDAVLSVGAGLGGFGAESPGEHLGLSVSGGAGLRMRVDNNLAIRADAMPLIIVPASGGSAGGHIDVLIRAELSF